MEAPTLRLPVINVGSRQSGRLHAENVVFIPSETSLISKTIDKFINDQTFYTKLKQCSMPYGTGHASKQIVHVLKNLTISEELMIKEITY